MSVSITTFALATSGTTLRSTSVMLAMVCTLPVRAGHHLRARSSGRIGTGPAAAHEHRVLISRPGGT
jgi:hypothetical protein